MHLNVSGSGLLYCSFSKIWVFPNMVVHQTFSYQQLHISRKLPTHFLTDRHVPRLGQLKQEVKTQSQFLNNVPQYDSFHNNESLMCVLNVAVFLHH